jgi:hypothetical protein
LKQLVLWDRQADLVEVLCHMVNLETLMIDIAYLSGDVLSQFLRNVVCLKKLTGLAFNVAAPLPDLQELMIYLDEKKSDLPLKLTHLELKGARGAFGDITSTRSEMFFQIISKLFPGITALLYEGPIVDGLLSFLFRSKTFESVLVKVDDGRLLQLLPPHDGSVRQKEIEKGWFAIHKKIFGF